MKKEDLKTLAEMAFTVIAVVVMIALMVWAAWSSF